jgi:hypothetical protein
MAIAGLRDSFCCVIYCDVPVLSQRKIAPDTIEVILYDQEQNRGNPATLAVTENEWKSFSRSVLVPRAHGRRAHVLRNWNEYRQYAEPKE